MEKREYDNEAVYHVTYLIHTDQSVVKFWKFQEHIHRPPNVYIWPEHNPGFIYLFIFLVCIYLANFTVSIIFVSSAKKKFNYGAYTVPGFSRDFRPNSFFSPSLLSGK